MAPRWTYERVKKLYQDSGCILLEEKYLGLQKYHRFTCRCGNEHSNYFTNFRRGDRQCKQCRYSQISKSKEMSKGEAVKRVRRAGVNPITALRRSTNADKVEIWVTYRCQEEHNETERLSSLERRGGCLGCAKLTQNREKRLPYDFIYREFTELGLQLLTTKEGYSKGNIAQKIDYICECGSRAQGYIRGIREGVRCGCRIKRIYTDEERTEQRNYPEYHRWVKAVYRRDWYTCRKCSKKGGELHAHHIHSFKNYPDKRTDIDNGVTFCPPCHREFHSIYSFNKFNPENTLTFLEGEMGIDTNIRG